MRKDAFYISNKMTPTLEDMITQINTFEEFEERFSDEFLDDDDRVCNYLRELTYKYDVKLAPISHEAGFDDSYLGRIINKKDSKPSRDVLIAICLAMHTTVDEVQYLLKYAGYSPLYVRRKRDVIIWFGFMKQRRVMDVNTDLANRGYPVLGQEK